MVRLICNFFDCSNLSKYFVVPNIPAMGLIKEPLTSTLTSGATSEPMREAVLSKEKGIFYSSHSYFYTPVVVDFEMFVLVELSIPMTKKEVEHLKGDLPKTVLEGGDKYQLGYLEKRETKSFNQTMSCSVNSNLYFRHE